MNILRAFGLWFIVCFVISLIIFPLTMISCGQCENKPLIIKKYEVYSSMGQLIKTVECTNCRVFDENGITTLYNNNWRHIVSTSGTIVEVR